MKVAVVGGGITGLTAGYQLSRAGHQVTIFEKENHLGGLAAGFKEKKWRWSPERYFHHLFTSDFEAINLITELGLKQNLFFHVAKTSIFAQKRIFRFDSPKSILQSPFFSLPEKMRLGLVTLYLRMINDWSKLEKVSAQNWLKKTYGQKTFQLLWEPLLQGKFSSFSDQVSMAWFWSRIKKRSGRLGYLQLGFQTLINKLASKIKEKNGKIILNQEFKDLAGLRYFDKIIITISTPEWRKIKSLPSAYGQQLGKLKFVGAMNLVLCLKEKFLTDGTYWLNINSRDFPFVAVVEHTNLIDKKNYGGQNLLYVGGYYPANHRYFKIKKEEILKEFLPYLKIINPSFHQSSIINHQSFQSLSAQPVIPLNYAKIRPSMITPLKNVYLANQSLIYPWDRGINYAIKLGREVACLI